MKVRVRTAPSPTGMPHIGNTWAALINYLFAKRHNGVFILRIEDTDRERLVKGSLGSICETLRWLGLDYDEGPDVGGDHGPYIQSERLDIYKKYANQLRKQGSAYEADGALKFKITREGTSSWVDLVGNRTIEFDNDKQEDFVILKSDGYPTYNFAHVVDDYLMEITHVIRGSEYISSMPKYLMLHKSLGWEIPHYAHLPLLLGVDKAKLSKRHGAKSVLELKKEGFIKEAIVNFMALFGWHPPSDREMLSLEEMIAEFDLKDINLASPVFETQKLEWLNGEYIRAMSDEQLTQKLQDFLVDHPAKDKIAPVVPLIKARIKKLADFIPLTYFFWEKPEYDQEVFKNLKITELKKALESTLEKMNEMDRSWTAEKFETTFKELASELNISVRDMFQLVRVAISGQLVTPPLFESIQILGEEEARGRVQEALKFV